MAKREACCQKHLLRTHVSPMFLSFATQELLFPGTKFVSTWRRKHILLPETLFSMWQNWETSGTHVNAANVSGNMFLQDLLKQPDNKTPTYYLNKLMIFLFNFTVWSHFSFKHFFFSFLWKNKIFLCLCKKKKLSGKMPLKCSNNAQCFCLTNYKMLEKKLAQYTKA